MSGSLSTQASAITRLTLLLVSVPTNPLSTPKLSGTEGYWLRVRGVVEGTGRRGAERTGSPLPFRVTARAMPSFTPSWGTSSSPWTVCHTRKRCAFRCLRVHSLPSARRGMGWWLKVWTCYLRSWPLCPSSGFMSLLESPCSTALGLLSSRRWFSVADRQYRSVMLSCSRTCLRRRIGEVRGVHKEGVDMIVEEVRSRMEGWLSEE